MGFSPDSTILPSDNVNIISQIHCSDCPGNVDVEPIKGRKCVGRKNYKKFWLVTTMPAWALGLWKTMTTFLNKS